ncbi:MAG: adenosylcobinamide-GDP ribazoletransferase [Rectinemataceae bacterium]
MKKNATPGTNLGTNPVTNTGFARFLTIFTLISRIPVKRRFEADFSRADFWIPALSPLVSISALAGFGVGIALTGNLLLASIASIALQYFSFNLFHLDGLVDTADAMLPAATPERRLDILKDPLVGTYGLFCGLLIFSARLGAIILLAEEGILFSALIAGFLVAPLAGRLAAVLIPFISKPARPSGLGSLMRGFSLARIAAGSILAIAPAIIFGFIAGGWKLSALCLGATIVAAAVTAFFIARSYRLKVGGFTGDALGAAIEIGEVSAFAIIGIALRCMGGVLY